MTQGATPDSTTSPTRASSGATSDYLALDLGAESGRGVLGRFDGSRLTLEEIHRFPNVPVRMVNTLHWDLPRLFDDVKGTIRKARALDARLDGVGVDTWGVDFGLIGRDDTLLGNPVHYRDGRTAGILERAFALTPRDRLYELTGLQFMPFNTAFQLLAMRLRNSPLLEIAETFLMMPDLMHWLLTGRRAVERTNASTTQMLEPGSNRWSDAVCEGLGLPRGILPEIVEPGTDLGPMLPSVAEETNLGAATPSVIAPATHDTASAVAAVPARSRSGPGGPPDWCYISSGTWSLLGVETARPVIGPATFRHNFTNEGGIAGTTRLLKNIMGLWIVQECRRTWARAGKDWTYDELIPRAFSAPAFACLIDPDHPSFLPPGDMPARIAAYCRKTGQTPPTTEGGFLRCAMESLALKYRWGIDRLREVSGARPERIHVVGGGAQNSLLCQFTADATGLEVHAGPIEATAIGNILVQAMGRGKIGSIADLREIVARSFPIAVHEPRGKEEWDRAAERFDALMANPPE